MKILITGSDGQLGRALFKILPKQNSFFTTKKDFDITNRKQVSEKISSILPDIVIHTAAYTDVDGCEANPKLANLINVKGTQNVFDACKKVKAALVYISTDFVFDGKKTSPYREEDQPNPLSMYGKTKLQGEEIVKELSDHFIIRTAWLFGDGKNFVHTIVNLASQKDEIKVVSDQIGSPTYALDLAETIFQLIEKDAPKGAYHIANAGFCSWYELAKEIVKQKSLKTKITPTSTSEWQKIKPGSAKRPEYSVLDCSKIKNLGIQTRPWSAALKDYLKTF